MIGGRLVARAGECNAEGGDHPSHRDPVHLSTLREHPELPHHKDVYTASAEEAGFAATDACDADTSTTGMEDDLDPLLEPVQNGAEDRLRGIPVPVLVSTDAPGVAVLVSTAVWLDPPITQGIWIAVAGYDLVDRGVGGTWGSSQDRLTSLIEEDDWETRVVIEWWR
jgi:hypothetical protein